MGSSQESPKDTPPTPPDKKKWLPIAFGVVLSILLGVGAVTWMESISKTSVAPAEGVSASPVAVAAPAPVAVPVSAAAPVAASSLAPASKVDLTPDADGLSKAVVTLDTTAGMIKFKFYPQDAPNTVNRMVELIQKGFYNGLTFHRVVPGFIVQGGDPSGTGTGGSGQKLKAEFNNRHHLDGTLAMARTNDPDSADSQFYIALAPQPSLDHNYTVFGQVIDGLPAVHQLKVGDKINKMTVE